MVATSVETRLQQLHDCNKIGTNSVVLERFHCIRKFAQSDARMREVTTLLKVVATRGCNQS